MTDDLPFSAPLTDANPAAPAPRKHRHVWGWVWDIYEPFRACVRCNQREDAVAVRRGRTNRSRGLSVQRQVAPMLEMEHIPGNGPADARDVRFYAEIKSGPGWYSTRVEAELDNLPKDTGRIPLFVAASTPGPGHGRRQVYVTIALGDLVQMVGPHVQVHARLPDWIAIKRATE